METSTRRPPKMIQDLPDNVKEKIFSIIGDYQAETLVPQMAELLVQKESPTLIRDVNLREARNDLRIRESTNPVSVMNLELDINAHSDLWRGAGIFYREHMRVANEAQEKIDRINVDLNRIKQNYYFYEMNLARIRNGRNIFN